MGCKEDQWFDAKRAPGYDLNNASGRFELAKDVSSFANAEGGYLIIGLSTSARDAEQTEAVAELDLFPEAEFNAGAIRGVLREYLYPELKELDVKWVEASHLAGQGVGVIFVPPSPEHDRRFVLMKKEIEGDTNLRHIVFGIAVALDPLQWTRSERWIRCPGCDQTMAAGEPAGGSLTSSRKGPYAWSWTKARPSAPLRASWI